MTSVFHERKKETSENLPLADVIIEVLRKSGISLQGIEALQIHAEIFTNIFIRQKEDGLYDVSSDEFFCLILDEQLGWFPFLTDIVSSLRLPAAIQFLNHLLTYVNHKPELEHDLTEIRLLALGLSLSTTVLLDLLKVPQVQDESMLHSERFHKECEQFETNSARLSQIYSESLKLTVKLLSSENVLLQVINEKTFFSQVVQALSLAISILHPCSVESDVEKLLCKMYLGKLVVPVERAPLEAAKKKKKKNGMKRSHELKEHSKMVKVNLKKWHNIVGFQNEHLIVNRDNIKCDLQTKHDQAFSLVQILLKCFRREITSELFCDLLRIFCLIGKDPASYFYELLRHSLNTENSVRVLHHVLDEKQLITHVLELVRFYHDGITSHSATGLPQEIATILRENALEVPSKLLDTGRLKKSELELIVESGRQLVGQSDLDLLKRVISSKEPGWNDLFALGLKNENLMNWWNDGFFELVCQNASILVTQENAQHVFHVTCDALQHHGELEITTKLVQLFKRMFHSLSTPSQEDIILSIISNTDCSKSISQFQRQVSEEAVISELIPLLNKLTSATVQEHISTILYLCLYQPDVVIKQAVHMAVGNQAQVGLIVDVLRQFPSICKSCRPQVQRSRLIESCLDVLKNCTVNDNITKNASDFLTRLIKSYTFKLDSNSDVSIKLPGLLTPADVLQYFILPTLTDDACQSPTGSGTAVAAEMPEPLSTEQTVLHQNLSLHILLSLLASTEKSAVMRLQPFPMLIVLVKLYLENYFVFSDGQLEIGKLAIKQSSHLCLVRLIEAVAKFSKIFPESSYYWLRKQSLSSGWMHLALLKPVLDHCCDLEVQNLLASLMRQTSLTSGENVKLVMLLAGLAIVNDEMLLEVQHFVQHVKFTTSSKIMVLVIQQSLLMSLPSEMHRLVHLVEVLVECHVINIPGVSDVSVEDSGSTVSSSVAQLLADAAILCCAEVRCQSSLCHVANNYMSASQALVQTQPLDTSLTATLLVHHCQLLTCASGRACQVLQMSALDLMMKLKSAICARSGNSKAATECHLLKIRDLINCIQDVGIMQRTFSSPLGDQQCYDTTNNQNTKQFLCKINFASFIKQMISDQTLN
ncbi:hypothetical protein Btru_069700 [Bulinus truncatus]|nr:hypothetical protein Btru_069700 [Bulinus truncatus]